MREWKLLTCTEIICEHCRQRHRFQRHRFMCAITGVVEVGRGTRCWRPFEGGRRGNRRSRLRSEREPGKAVQAGKRGKELMTPGESASSNPICYRFKVWAFLFSPRRPSPFNCINENLAMDDGRNSEVFMHNCCVARMLPREVKLVPEWTCLQWGKYKALWAVQRTGYMRYIKNSTRAITCTSRLHSYKFTIKQ